MKALLHIVGLMAALLFSTAHAAAAQQGSCAAGAAGGIAQSLFAGSLDGSAPERGDYASDQAWQQARQDWMGEVTRMAAVIGAIPGFLLSGGDANNVNLAAGIAQSGIANNYLNHTETVERAAARARCKVGDASGCTRLQELDDLDRGRDLLLRSRCQSGMTAACRSEIVKFESAMFSFQEASKLSYDTEREYLEAVGDAWQELKSEYDSSLQLLGEVRLSNNAVDIVVTEILHQRFTENTNAVLRLIIGAGDAASGAIYGLYDLSDILVNNPAALKAAAEAVLDDPSIIPREMWEPFRLRIAADDHAGAIGLLGPELLFAAVKRAGAIGRFATNRLPIPNDLPTNVHPGQQGKHIPGHNNFDPNRSPLNADANPTELLSGVHSGQYSIVRTDPRGNPVVDFGSDIGSYVQQGQAGVPTRYGTIHYGNNGAHIVPANPNIN